MKKIIILSLLICGMILSISTAAYANDEISVYLDNEELTFDVKPMIYNNRTMVPMRAIFEALGAEVTWNDSTRSIRAIDKAGNKSVSLSVGDRYMQVLGTKPDIILLDVPAIIDNGRTLVPIRAVSSVFGCTVVWSPETKTVNIYSENETVRVISKDTYQSILNNNNTAIETWIDATLSIDTATNNGSDQTEMLKVAKATQLKMKDVIESFSESAKLCGGYNETQRIKSVLTSMCDKLKPLTTYSLKETNVTDYIELYTTTGIELVTLYESTYHDLDIISKRINTVK